MGREPPERASCPAFPEPVQVVASRMLCASKWRWELFMGSQVEGTKRRHAGAPGGPRSPRPSRWFESTRGSRLLGTAFVLLSWMAVFGTDSHAQVTPDGWSLTKINRMLAEFPHDPEYRSLLEVYSIPREGRPGADLAFRLLERHRETGVVQAFQFEFEDLRVNENSRRRSGDEVVLWCDQERFGSGSCSTAFEFDDPDGDFKPADPFVEIGQGPSGLSIKWSSDPELSSEYDVDGLLGFLVRLLAAR